MRITIIPSDRAVYVDNQCSIGLDLSSCNVPENVQALQWYSDHGDIEFKSNIPNEEITSLPDWANACVSVWTVANTPVPPTDDKIIEANKIKAEGLLLDSDWSMLPDVNLSNKADWESYRSGLRSIAINPTLNPVWPVKPESVWS